MRTRSGSIVVKCDAWEAWHACSSLERFPEFITGIEQCTPLGHGRHAWQGRAFGIVRTWTSTWTTRIEPELIAWVTDDPMVPDGRVVVEALGPRRARVSIEMRYEPQGAMDRFLVNGVATRVRLWWDLRAFRRWAEAQCDAAIRNSPD